MGRNWQKYINNIRIQFRESESHNSMKKTIKWLNLSIHFFKNAFQVWNFKLLSPIFSDVSVALYSRV